VQFIALDDLHGSSQTLLYAVCEGLAGVAAIHQHAFNAQQVGLATIQGGQGTVAVGYFSRGDRDGMRQSLRVNRDVALDARHLLPASYALSSALSVFFTLCASTIKKLVMALRPCLARAAPTDFF